MPGFSAFPPRASPKTKPTNEGSPLEKKVVEVGKAVVNADDPAANVTPLSAPTEPPMPPPSE